jgi:hypothetical protein
MFHRAAMRRDRRTQAITTATALDALRLTDAQLGVIGDVALQIPPWRRSLFLQELASHLRSVEIVSDATVHRAAFAVRASLFARAGLAPWTSG